ncbi:MAG: sugar ABC transporter permease [Anaerolineales bacterium]
MARHFGKRASPYLFFLPFLIVYGVIILTPIAQGLYVSLTDWDMMSPEKHFVGLKNFEYLFFKDPLFWESVRATLQYIFTNVPIKIALGLGLALIFNQKLPGMAFHRGALFLPFVINIAAVGILFQWIMDPQLGMLNYYLELLGLSPQKWLVDPTWTMEAVVGVTVWWSIAFNVIVFLAGLQEIPEELYEAARIDGANAWHCFWHITLPCLRGSMLFVVVMQIIGSFQAFGNIFMLTDGGPANSTNVLMVHLYKIGFFYFQMGPAAAIGVIIFIIVMALTIAVLATFRKQVEY